MQPFSLSGAGAVSGATSVTLKSFTQIDGTLLTMTDFGTIGFGTLEPGNSTFEEQISFTGVTQNANGTATLTGISTVLMVSPYTQTSGLAQTHAGSTTFVISNTSGFYNELTSKSDDETVTGTWTFTNPNYPRMDTDTPEPTDNEQLVPKSYVDNVVVSGAPNANTTTKGIVQLATQAQTDARTTVGSTGAFLVSTPDQARSTLLSDYKADTGAANAYVIAPVPSITTYTVGQIFSFKATNTNTTTSTLNVNGLGAKTLKKNDGTVNLIAGDVTAGQIVVVEYDGTNFQLVTPGAKSLTPNISSSNINQFLTTTDGVSSSWGLPFDYQTFTSGGTWTKPTNLSGNEIVLVQAWGGGGGGGGTNATAGVSSGGGGGGCFSEAKFRASDLTSTVTITIGSGGTASSGAVGGVGGTTSFGAFLSAFGGGGGASANSASNGAGGGGGGVFSTGGSGSSATPGGGGTPGDGVFGGAAGGTGAGNRAIYGGGGGGGGAYNGGGGAGAAAYFGGAGGGGGNGNIGSAGAGGVGMTGYGGAGGAGSTGGTGSAGNAPAGGGGGGGGFAGSSSSTGGVGARGEVRVWVFY